MPRFQIQLQITDQKGLAEFVERNIRHATVALLNPQGSTLTEIYRCDFMKEFADHREAIDNVITLSKTLITPTYRMRVTAPYLDDLVSHSHYIQSNFLAKRDRLTPSIYPISMDKARNRVWGLDREYNKSKYKDFVRKWTGEEVELCMYDDYLPGDFDWFDLYENFAKKHKI